MVCGGTLEGILTIWTGWYKQQDQKRINAVYFGSNAKNTSLTLIIFRPIAGAEDRVVGARHLSDV